MYIFTKIKTLLSLAIIFNLTTVVLTELGYLLNDQSMFDVCFCMLGFCNGVLRVIVYEFLTDVAYPCRASVTIGLLHTTTNVITLALTLTSDRVFKSHDEWGLRSNIFNDVMQFLFLMGLTWAGLKNIKQ